jgi:hypothetical protein
MYDYETRYNDDISFKRGDRLEIVSQRAGDDWWKVRHMTSNYVGFIPSNYVVIDDDSIESQDWWYSVDRGDAIKQLMLPGNPPGTFLVRNSSAPSAYALSVLDREDSRSQPQSLIIRHYLIRKMDDGHSVFITPRQVFKTINELIEFYRKPENKGAYGLPCHLTMPCPKEALPVPFKELEVRGSDIVLHEKLGSGQFGEVCAATFRGVVRVAVKTVKLQSMTEEQFLAEAETMHMLRHRKLVQLLGVCRAPLYIITELMSKGSLLDYLRQDGGRELKFEMLTDMAAQVADGMSYLESKHFIHRDLRAANVLVGDRNIVKVADFGLARMLDQLYEEEGVYTVRPETKFPIKWTAPEAFESGQFTVKSDVWSFGILLYEIFTFGRAPYCDMDNNTVKERIMYGYRMPNPNGTPIHNTTCLCPEYLYDIMKECWNGNPECRPTFESLKHTFEDYPVSSERPYLAQ